MAIIFEHDATPTWSGFIYQGLVAVYLAVKQICELMSGPNNLDKQSIGLSYQLEIENCEDVAIISIDGNEKNYLSIHQVKNRKEKKISDYRNTLVQLMLEKGFLKKQNFGTPEAYLHTSSEIKENEYEIDELLTDWKNTILGYYDKIALVLETEYEENDRTDFQQEIKEKVLKEPIGLNRAKYKELLDDIKKCTEKNCNVEEMKKSLKSFKEYLDSELEVKEIDEKVKLYKYEDDQKFGGEDDLFDRIVRQIKEYRKITKNFDYLTDKQYEYIGDKLLGYMRKYILERHELSKRKSKYHKSILFNEIIQIMDEGISADEAEANIKALRRIYDNALSEYCLITCKKICTGVDNYECRLLNSKYSKIDLADEEFKRMCFIYNPNCGINIENRECISVLMQKDGLQDSVFEVLKKVEERHFIEDDNRTRTVLKDGLDNAFLTAISGSKKERVVNNIIKGINVNAELVSPIFDADELITVHLHSDDGELWDSDYSEISEKYMSTEAISDSENNRNSICRPKKPKFVKAQDIIDMLG